MDINKARIAAIAQIMESGDASLLTGSNKPKTEAIEAITGAKITAAERDAAFAEYHKLLDAVEESKAEPIEVVEETTAVIETGDITPESASSRDSIAGSSDQDEATDAATTDAAAETTSLRAQRGNPENGTEEPALIISTVKGVKTFRRAGMAFTSAPTTVLLRDLTDAQIDALKGEKMLTVQETAGN